MKNLCLLVAFFVTTILPAQSTYTVDNKPNAKADFNNLQTAVNTVPVGSTLLVQGSSTSYGDITIEKKITIKGTGYFLNENPFTQTDFLSSKVSTISLKAGSSGSIITGFDCSSSFYTYNNVSNITFMNNYVKSIGNYLREPIANDIFIYNNFIYGFTSWYSSTSSDNFSIKVGDNSTVSGNYISSGTNLSINVLFSNNVMFQYVTTNGSTYKNNIFRGHVSLPDLTATNVTSNIYNNIIYHPAITVSTKDNKNNKLTNTNPFIEDSDDRYSTDGKYILSSDSPAKGAGVGGVDCGMFAGGYKLSGIPDIPNIYEFNVPTTGYSNSTGIQVNVKVKSNN